MILVTGATGKVGRVVIQEILARGGQVCALSRHPDGSGRVAGVEQRFGDLTDPATLKGVFEGATAMFLFPAPGISPEVAEAARRAGVRRIVVLSSAVVEREGMADSPLAKKHRAAEAIARAGQFEWTILRPDSFAANSLNWAELVRAERRVRAPFGRSQRNPIHEADIGAVAVASLTGDAHAGSIYRLTGPESLSQVQQVEAIAAAIGEPIRFEEVPPHEARLEMGARMPQAAADQLLAYLEKCVDRPARIEDTVERVLGRPAFSFARWARDHADAFR